jgi:hypothetical protein
MKSLSCCFLTSGRNGGVVEDDRNASNARDFLSLGVMGSSRCRDRTVHVGRERIQRTGSGEM